MKFPKSKEGQCPNTCYSIAELKKMCSQVYIDELCFADEVDQDKVLQEVKLNPRFNKYWNVDLDLTKRMFCPEHLFEIRLVDHKVGYGVFAKYPIPRNSFIGEYSGVVKNISDNKSSGYSFIFQEFGIYIDAVDKGNFTRYINHAINCNLDVMHSIHNGYVHIILFTNRDIKKGEELLYNYGPLYWRKNESYQEIFNNIYKYKLWGENIRGLGCSGVGSCLENARLYMRFLSDFLKANNIKSVFDCGCGDWEFSRYIDWHNIDYIGYDIVEDLIEFNALIFTSNNVTFKCKNVLEIDLPAAELLICKDFFQHIPNKDVIKFLKKLKQYKYCLIVNDISDKKKLNNIDIGVGGYHCLDLLQEPFGVQAKKIFSYRYDDKKKLKQVFLIENKKYCA